MDETEKGWFIQYIDRDPKLLAKQAAMDQKASADISEEERIQRAINAQIEATKDSLADREESTATELQKDGTSSISLTLGGHLMSKKRLAVFDADDQDGEMPPPSKRPAAVSSVFGADEEVDRDRPMASSSSGGSALAALKTDEERRKNNILLQEEAKNRKDYWLHPGLLVKIMNKSLSDGRFYKQKGTVLRVLDDYVGEIRLSDSNAVLRLDQADLETVVPKVVLRALGVCCNCAVLLILFLFDQVGSVAMIVNGRGRGCRGTILRINECDYNCDVRMSEGVLSGREISGVEYEDICKISSDI